MRTRSSLEYTIPRRRNRRRSRQQQEAIPIVDKDPIPMADDRPMAEQLQAPTGGFESAIVVPPINAQNFELKSSLINLVQNRIFRGGNDEEPHAHIRHFESITNNQRYPDVPNTTIKLLLFPFSLDGVAKTWLDKEPPNSILTWDDLRFKELLRKCPHHGFSLMHQLDTFYNSLSYNDQDSLNSAAGGNFLYKSPTEGLQIIENKAKVRCSRNAMMRVSTNAPPSSSTSSSSNFEFQQMAAALEDKMTLTFRNEMNEMKNMMKALVPTPVPIKAVEERCTTCGSNHSYNVCPMTRGGYEYPVYHDNFQQFQQTASVGENDKVQIQSFGNCSKDYCEITFADALILMPKVSKDVGKALSNKEKLNEMANTPVSENCSAIILKKLPEKLEDPGQFLIPDLNDSSSPTSTIVEKFESLVGEIIKQKEEVKKISDQLIEEGAISHIFPNNNLEDSFKMGDEDLNFISNKKLDKEDLIPIPRESKMGKEYDFPLCDDFQSFKTFSNPLFEKKDDSSSRNDESILKEKVHKETLKSYLNPLFEDDEEIISIEVSRQISPKVNSEPSIESLPKDDFDNDDDLFEMDSNNDEWKRILYGEDFERMDSDSDKTKDFDKSSSSVFKSLSDEFEPGGSSYVEGNDLVCYEDFHVSDALFSTINEDKVFNPGILVDKNSKVHEPNVLPTLPTRSSEMMLDFDLENFQVEPKNDILNPKVLVFDPGILDVFDPLHPPLIDFHVTKALSGFTFSLLKLFSKKFFEPGIKNAT
ncbi:hypothetical protein Tco_1064191, partial [Tanacetum coccineum]